MFRSLFLDGDADQMEPVRALALYYDFRELTPVGKEGDEMIRLLADRLVAVDLLDRAAQLLEHQVKFRLRREKKAQIGVRLAAIHLTDIPQMTSKFAGVVLPIHRHGNSVPFVALRCGDFGGLIKFGTPFGKVFHHLDAPLPSFSPLR